MFSSSSVSPVILCVKCDAHCRSIRLPRLLDGALLQAEATRTLPRCVLVVAAVCTIGYNLSVHCMKSCRDV